MSSYSVVVLVHADEDVTAEQHAAFCQRYLSHAQEIAPASIEDRGGEVEELEIEAVRSPRGGEAEGTYYRKNDGTLQITGYSIETPEAVRDVLNRAWDHAHQTWPTE